MGSMAIATQGSIFIARDPDAFPPDLHYVEGKPGSSHPFYRFSKPVGADPEISALVLALPRCSHLAQLVKYMKQCVHATVVEGRNATADTFYSSQGQPCTSLYQTDEQVEWIPILQITTPH